MKNFQSEQQGHSHLDAAEAFYFPLVCYVSDSGWSTILNALLRNDSTSALLASCSVSE